MSPSDEEPVVTQGAGRRELVGVVAQLATWLGHPSPDAATAVWRLVAELGEILRHNPESFGPFISLRVSGGRAWVSGVSAEVPPAELPRVRDLESRLAASNLEGFSMPAATAPETLAWWLERALDPSVTTPTPGTGIRPIIRGEARSFALGETPNQGTPVPRAPFIDTSRPTLVRDGVTVLARAARSYERALAGAASGTLDGTLIEELALSGDAIAHLVEHRPDLAMQAHRIRLQGAGGFAPAALNAASTSLLASLMGRCIELRKEARPHLARGALVASLPFALNGRPPSPAALCKADTDRCCDLFWSRWPTVPASEPEPAWWRVAHLLTREFRLGLEQDDGSPTMLVSRAVLIASAYDCFAARPLAATAVPGAPRDLPSPTDALKTLARNPGIYDPTLVSVLTAVIAAFR